MGGGAHDSKQLCQRRFEYWITMLIMQPSQAGMLGFQLPSGWLGFGGLQPGAVRVPRKSLNLNFAVLLMRSTYEAADFLDFIPMDAFQVKFFKFRQSEFEAYKLLVDPLPVPVGNLSNPLYFDFIAFVQWSVLSKEMPNAPQVFQEYCEDCEEDPLKRPYRLVRRDPSFADNSQLPSLLQLQVGRNIINYLQSGFRDLSFDMPNNPGKDASIIELAAQVQKILDIFVANGFCISARIGSITQAKRGGSWVVTIEGPANLWGLRTLQFRRALVADAFDALAILSFLNTAGFNGSFEIEADSASLEEFWTITPIDI